MEILESLLASEAALLTGAGPEQLSLEKPWAEQLGVGLKGEASEFQAVAEKWCPKNGIPQLVPNCF